MCNIHTIARLLAMQNIHYHIFAGITGMAEDYFVLVREGVKNTHGGIAQSRGWRPAKIWMTPLKWLALADRVGGG